MKPNFALSLSFDGLRMMHRAEDGWHLVGEVALDDPDMTGALERLRDAAKQLESGPMATKLLIPNDQIKYIALDTTRAEDEDVQEALHGATPYDVSELSYDFAKGGGRTYVAAVAKETLQEAKQFASEHGFNPICFAAVPEPFTFVGEAFFGSVDGKSVERDSEPVVVMGTAAVTVDPAPAPETTEAEVEETAEVASEPESEPEAAEAEDMSETVEEVEEPIFSPDPEPEPEPDDDAPAEDAPETEAEAPQYDAEAQPDAEVPAEDEPQGDVENEVSEEPEQETEAEPDGAVPLFASLRADRLDGAPEQAAETPREEPTLSRQEPPALAVPTDGGHEAARPVLAPSRDDELAAAAGSLTTDVPDAEAAPAITGEAPTAPVAWPAQPRPPKKINLRTLTNERSLAPVSHPSRKQTLLSVANRVSLV